MEEAKESISLDIKLECMKIAGGVSARYGSEELLIKCYKRIINEILKS